MKRILFFHIGGYYPFNKSVQDALKTGFPETEIVRVNVRELLDKDLFIKMLNTLAVFREYGLDIVTRKRYFHKSRNATAYIHKKAKQMAAKIHEKYRADCSFQTWSLLDFSYPGCPHFVYTDRTYESCKEEPYYGKAIWTPERTEAMISREKQIYENAAGIFTFGNNTRRVLMEKYGISPEKIIVAGVGTNIPYDRLKKIPIVPERYYQKRILFVGEEWDLKGGEELFSAFKKVRERIGGATLTIAGCHPGIICPGVEVLGKINYEELIKQYARASVFCLPSKHEAFGVVFIEAMASGLPVIALNLSEAPDFVKNNETGFLVEHNDKAGLVEVLLRMLTDPGLCMSFAERARVLAEERYNWNVVSNKISSRMKAICEVS